MPTTDVRNANALRQARFRVAMTDADKEQRNKDLRARRALRRELHDRRSRTFTAAHNVKAPQLQGSSPTKSINMPDGTVDQWEYNQPTQCVQGGVSSQLPRQLPTIQQVREHIATTNWQVPVALPRRRPIVGSAPSGRYLAVRRG